MAVNFKYQGTDLEDLCVKKEWFMEGNLWTWGSNAYGQLGDNTIIHRSSPVQTVSGGTNWRQISVGRNLTAGIKTDGTLWLWGRNYAGGLGDNTTTNKSSPIQTVSGGTNWRQVVVDGFNRAAAIKTDGTLWLWGLNSLGLLGTNDTVHRSSPVQTVAGGSNWKQVDGGGDQTVALKTDGTIWCWGRNDFGQLGDNSIVHRSSPVQEVTGGTTWTQVKTGNRHVIALKSDGTLWGWGLNSVGQLGDNTQTPRSSPVQTVAGGTNWKQISAGRTHSAAIKTDGTLWLWGTNSYGELGTNDLTNRSSPVQTVSGGTNWKLVACGYSSFAIKTDGTLWVWGANYYGMLGTNDTVHRSSPVQTVAGGNNWKSVDNSFSINSGALRDYEF